MPFIALLLLGQFLALLISLTGVFSQLLSGSGSSDKINIPTTQSLCHYVLLMLVFVPIQRKQQYDQRQLEAQSLLSATPTHSQSGALSSSLQNGKLDDGYVKVQSIEVQPAVKVSNSADHLKQSKSTSSAAPWYIWFLLALADVLGNACMVHAFRYTSITSIQLLDCFTIPMVVLLSYLALGSTYNAKQLIGCAVSLCGLISLVVSDTLHSSDDDIKDNKLSLSSQLYGDILVLAGAMLYAISNVGQERFVKHDNTIDWLANIGLYGSLISAAIVLCFEFAELQHYNLLLQHYNWLYLLGFNVSLFLLYILTPLLIQHSSALFLNLSLLSADAFSVMFAVLLFSQQLTMTYLLAFIIIVSGLITYNIATVTSTNDSMSLMAYVQQMLPQSMQQKLQQSDSNIDAQLATSHDLDQPTKAPSTYQQLTPHVSVG